MRYLSKCLFLIVCFIPMLSAAAVKVDKAAPQFSLQNSQGEMAVVFVYSFDISIGFRNKRRSVLSPHEGHEKWSSPVEQSYKQWTL